MEMPFKEGLAFERSRFMACVKSEQSAALRHIFFAERQAPKVPGIDKSATPRAVQRVGIIGAGTMGGGIAMSFASAGIPVQPILTNFEQGHRDASAGK